MSDSLVNLLSDLFKIDRDGIKNDLKREDIDIWDSLKHMELVVALEQTFGVELTIDDIMAMQSIGEIKRILEEKNIDC